MLKDLLDLKKAGAFGIKLEFESEYIEDKKAFEFAELIHRTDLNLCIKLGGAASIQDLRTGKKLCANSIVAPMIESSYAVEKFLETVESVYGNEYPELFINIETKTAFENIEEIIESAKNKISGIVLGRSDLKNSLNIENPNDEKILNYCNTLSDICKKNNKKFVIGGKINSNAINFLNKIQGISYVETRKVIYNINDLNENNLKLALEFELKTLKSKNTNFSEDTSRIKFIENSLKSEILK